MTRRLVLLLALLALAVSPAPAAAQGQPTPLGTFVASVGRLWYSADADGLVELAPADGRLLLDLAGAGSDEVQRHHAAAALRRLFAEGETVSVRPSQSNISGGVPVSGFGELNWVRRPRGVTDTHSSIVYVGAVWEDGAWRLRELRLLR